MGEESLRKQRRVRSCYGVTGGWEHVVKGPSKGTQLHL